MEIHLQCGANGTFHPRPWPGTGRGTVWGNGRTGKQPGRQERLSNGKPGTHGSVKSYAFQAMQDEVLAQVARRIGASDAGQMTLATLLEAAVDQCRSDPDNPYR